jgi:energy-coupling factor transporter ATP-binding protein EcfA2
MPTTLNHTEPTAESAPSSPLDMQRAALRDLVALATESATTESEIERTFEAATEQWRKEFDKSTWTLRQRYESAKDGVRTKHAAAVGEIDRKHRSELSTAEADTVPRVARVDRDHESLEHALTEKLNQATWLAESVFDVSQNQAREEYKKVKERVQSHNEALAALEAQAAATVRLYGFIPAPAPTDAAAVPATEGAEAEFDARRAEAARQIEGLRRLFVPKLFIGPRAFLLGGFLTLAAAALAHWQTGYTRPDWKIVGIAAGATLVVVTALLITLRMLAKKQVGRGDAAFRKALADSAKAIDAEQEYARGVRERRIAEARQKRDAEVQRAKDHYLPIIERSAKQRDEKLLALRTEYRERLARLTAERDDARRVAEESFQRQIADMDARRDRDLALAADKHGAQERESRTRYEQARAELDRRLREGLAQIRAPVSADANGNGHIVSWNDPAWSRWTPPKDFSLASAVRFGDLHVDLKRIAESVPGGGNVRLDLPRAFNMPASVGFPRQASLLIQADRALWDQAIRALQMVMTRLLTSLPPGRVRFTIIDPVGLGQNFAGFMHLADHDENLVGGRIWTEQDQIEQRLTHLTAHMETVIQKYLRNEFETIDDYNAQAGELAEPYRFLVIADFPNTFTDEALRRLAAISSSGARCGVYTLIVRDTRMEVPGETLLDTLEAHSVNLVQHGDRFVWKDDVFRQFPLAVDPPPGEEFLNRILDVVGRGAKEANRVEVPFDSIAPSKEKFWSGSATDEVAVPVGRMGATRLQLMRLGRGVAQHVLIAGKTGSGKSTLLHALVTNVAMWYSPDEVELYLIDFKKGVEFKTYATHGLPHARAIAVESDREFGLSVLQRLDAELARRGEMFRKGGVQDLASYRRMSGAPKMPRTLLIIDEFQEFFSEDDKLAQDAAVLLDRLVRQGRAFGIHVLLGSQTIGGSGGLPRTTIGQMAVRVALQTSEADSQLILGDNNAAAKLLSRPGEAIYNDQGGLVEGNSPFQVAWLPDEKREQYLVEVKRRTEAAKMHPAPTIVFEGNAPADLTKNGRLIDLLERRAAPRPGAGGAVEAFLGEPVAIKDPTAILFRRQSGSNALVIGQYEEPAMAVMCAMIASIAAQRAPGSAIFYVLDGTPADSPLAGVFAQLRAALPHDVKLVDYRAVPQAVAEIAAEVRRRQENDQPGAPDIFLFVYALQRYRALRKSEDSFSFSTSDEEKAPDPGKQFAELLREGPPLGVHVVAWTDTAVALDRTLERQSMREFDNRVLFQMSASDSSNLIDSPAANKLGFHRALSYSEEQGVMEKFRPYGLPEQAWLEQLKQRLSAPPAPAGRD